MNRSAWRSSSAAAVGWNQSAKTVEASITTGAAEGAKQQDGRREIIPATPRPLDVPSFASRAAQPQAVSLVHVHLHTRGLLPERLNGLEAIFFLDARALLVRRRLIHRPAQRRMRRATTHACSEKLTQGSLPFRIDGSAPSGSQHTQTNPADQAGNRYLPQRFHGRIPKPEEEAARHTRATIKPTSFTANNC